VLCGESNLFPNLSLLKAEKKGDNSKELPPGKFYLSSAAVMEKPDFSPQRCQHMQQI
jgi:hypothetical protein